MRGHVEAVLSDRTFLLSGDDHLGTGASVLAVSARPLRYVLAPGGRFDAGAMVGRPAQVVGSVHRLDAEAVRREMGVELEASDRQANLVLYISATEMLPAAEILPQHVTPVEPAVLRENTDEYMGRGVVVEGRITERVGSVAVVLDDALLVMTRVPLGRDAVPGEEVTARGSARRFDIGELEHMIAIDLEERVFERFRTKPVVLALEIERS